MTRYVFDSAGEIIRNHLTALETTLDPLTIDGLRDSGVRPGWHCLEVGGGGGSIAAWLSEHVGPRGHVVMTETDTRWSDWLQRSNVEVLEHDITTDSLPEGPYDLIHARLVLILLQERHDVLKRLVDTLKPGGVLVTEDFDVSGCHAIAENPDDAEVFNRTMRAYLDALEDSGVDTNWGSKAYPAMRAAGLVDVRMDGKIEVWRGNTAATALLHINFGQLEEKIRRSGAVTGAEFDRARQLLLDDHFELRSFAVVRNVGRRPRAGSAHGAKTIVGWQTPWWKSFWREAGPRRR